MARKKKGNPVSGWVMFHKPYGMGSTQAVSFVRRVFNAQKAGHGGTLDPLAEGVLPIALGEATKTLPYILAEDKSYRFTVKWGSETDSCDLDGDVVQTSDSLPLIDVLKDEIQAHFVGEISQIPPAHSALKIDGKRACDRVRAGEVVEMKARNVTVYRFDLLEFTTEEATFEVDVSKGTYVRSLARDVGRALGCYAHVVKLIRINVNKIALSDCVTKEKLDECAQLGQSAETYLSPVDCVLDDISVLEVAEDEVSRLKSGQDVAKPLDDLSVKEGQTFRAKNVRGSLISLVKCETLAGGVAHFKPIRNFNL